MTLIILAIAWLVGIVAADMFHLPLVPLLVAATCFGVVAIPAGRVHHARIVLVAMCAASLGGARLAAAQVQTTPQSVWQQNGSGNLVLEGVIVADPQRGEEGQRVLLAADRIVREGAAQRVEGLVQVKLPAYPERRYGERLRLVGALKSPRGPKRPGEFDYRAYLARKRIFSLMEPKTAELLARNNANPLFAWLFNLRDAARHVLMRELPEPQSSLAVGMLLGIQSSIPDDVYSNFSQTGTSHILVISGWNISIVGAALYALAGKLKLSKGATFALILGAIGLYTAFVGASPTVLRAALMGGIVVLGRFLDRQTHSWTMLFAACALLTALDPQVLWDLGFQLSALATASLFAFGKGTEAMLNKTFLRARWLDWAREALTATMAAQILALPLILFQFGNLSLVALIANVALLPMVPYAMLFGALALVGGMLWLPLGQLLALPAYLLLLWLAEGARMFAALPWASVQVASFPLWVLLAYYVVVLAARFVRLPKKPAGVAVSSARSAA